MSNRLRFLGIFIGVLVLTAGSVAGPAYSVLRPFPEASTIDDMRARYAQPPSRFITVDGVQMHIRDEGEGPPLVMLPGHLGSLHMYDAWVPFFAPHYRVIRIDWPPYGLSLPDPSDDYSSPRGADLVVGILDQLNLSQVSLVGTSNGATVAAHIAALHPERIDRLALSTFPLGPPPRREISDDLREQARLHMGNMEYRPASLYRAILEDIFFDPANVTDAIVSLYTDMNNHPHAYAAQTIYVKNNRALYDAGTLPALYARVTAPTLLQWGDGGIVLPASFAQGSADVLVNAPVVLLRYPQSGHMPMLEEPEKTAKDLLAFLRGELDDQARPAGS